MKNQMKKLFLALILVLLGAHSAMAQAEPFLGQIIYVPYNFCPRGWADANGQILSIAQNTALFSLLGTTYGGNGQTTFALPNLQGRVAISQGQGAGLSQRDLGEAGGEENVTMSIAQMPAHTHALVASQSPAAKGSPNGNYLAQSGSYRRLPDAPTTLNPASVGVSGAGQPQDNMPPYLVIRACIALEGIYPPRN